MTLVLTVVVVVVAIFNDAPHNAKCRGKSTRWKDRNLSVWPSHIMPIPTVYRKDRNIFERSIAGEQQYEVHHNIMIDVLKKVNPLQETSH